MQIINEQTAPAFAGERTVITIGAYDGVHLGHQAVISHVYSVRSSWERGRQS